MPGPQRPTAPEGHPISEQRAKELIASDLGDVYRGILRDCILPVCWHPRSSVDGPAPIQNSGTVTIAQTSERILGITAAHVVRGLQEAQASQPHTIQLLNAIIKQLDLIAVSDRLDLATFAIPEGLLATCGKPIVPISIIDDGRQEPQEGRGIMLAGYPGKNRVTTGQSSIDWGMFTGLGVARVVTEEQVTWVAEREFAERHPRLPDLPPNAELGGISGGPLIAWFENEAGTFTYCSLVAIISQANAQLENVIAKRIHFIRRDGSIREL